MRLEFLKEFEALEQALLEYAIMENSLLCYGNILIKSGNLHNFMIYLGTMNINVLR